MTQDELLLLSKGRIPAEVILPRLLTHIEIADRDRDPGEPGELTMICERQGLDYATIAKVIYRWKNPECLDGALRSLDFDTADKLLCGAGMFDVWRTDLLDYYLRVDLAWKKCECPGCETWFRPKQDHAGITAPKYCSKSCRHAARNQRLGRTTKIVKVQRGQMGVNAQGTHTKRCRSGHRRTPENTYVRSNGKVECLVCKRKANNASHARRQQARKAALAAA